MTQFLFFREVEIIFFCSFIMSFSSKNYAHIKKLVCTRKIANTHISFPHKMSITKNKIICTKLKWVSVPCTEKLFWFWNCKTSAQAKAILHSKIYSTLNVGKKLKNLQKLRNFFCPILIWVTFILYTYNSGRKTWLQISLSFSQSKNVKLKEFFWNFFCIVVAVFADFQWMANWSWNFNDNEPYLFKF